MQLARKLTEALKLVSLGKAHGYLTTREVELWLEYMTPEPERLQQMLADLGRLDIKVLDCERPPEDEAYDICTDITKEIGDAVMSLYAAWGDGLTYYLPTEQQKKIFRLRIGIEDGHIHSREELAEEYGVPVEQISRLERKAYYHGRFVNRSRRRMKESID